MYLLRRVWDVEPVNTRMAATLAVETGKRFEDAGQREGVRVYFNGGSVPGEKGQVYMEWIAEVIDSPYRGDNVFPSDPLGLGERMSAIAVPNRIEFYELMTPDKALDLED
jgi:hypothetical protein